MVLTRSGSGRVPQKNSRNFHAGKSLLELKLADLEDAGEFDLIISATDCEFCERQSKKFKKTTTFIRKKMFCTDSAGSIEALNEVVQAFDIKQRVSLFQCTSPFFGVREIQEFSRKERVMSHEVTLMTAHKSLDDIWTKSCERIFKDAPRRQQDREGFYIENSAAYSFPIFSGVVAFCLEKVKLLETSARAGFDINTEEDFALFSSYYKAVKK